MADIPAMVSPGYRAHVPAFREPLPRGIDALTARLKAQEPVQAHVAHLVTDGDLVFVHLRLDQGATTAAADILRLDRHQRIVEHWNARRVLERDEADAHFGDAIEPYLRARHHDEEALKEFVLASLEEVWRRGDPEAVPRYYAPDYVQHSPGIAGGIDRIVEIVRTDIRSQIQAGGGEFGIDVHHVGAEGDLVFLLLSILMAGLGHSDGARSTNIDVYRIDRDGLLAEHWDVLQLESAQAKPFVF